MALRHAIIALLRVRQKNQARVNESEPATLFSVFKTTMFVLIFLTAIRAVN